MAAAEFDVLCPHCKTEFTVEEMQYPALTEIIVEREQQAEHDGREEAEREFDGMVWPHEVIDAQEMQELSLAIRMRDWAEAELLVDRIASKIGADAEEKVAQGRFNPLVAA